jgi:hypothetical protein
MVSTLPCVCVFATQQFSLLSWDLTIDIAGLEQEEGEGMH